MKTDAKDYLIYARKSTDDTTNQKNTLSYQVSEGLRLSKNDHLPISSDTIEEFMENGVIQESHTAFKASELTLNENGTVSYGIGRPKFQKMMALLAKGKYAGVICLCWDRISRNDGDAMLIKQLMDNGVDFKFVQATYDKTTSGALHRDIDGMFSIHYSRVISEKVKNTFDKFRAEGRCVGPACIGYLDKGSKDKPLDPARAPIVARIFELYSTGEWSISQLAKWANKEGLTTKPWRGRRTRQEMSLTTEVERPQFSRPVNAKTIENILKNPFYIGKHRTKDGKTWDCKHPALIDHSLFYKVQGVLHSRTTSIHYVDKQFYTYRGLLKCSCGRSYSPYEQKGIVYYRSRCKEGCTNKEVNLNDSIIEKEVIAFLNRIHFTDEELVEIESGAHSGLEKIAQKRNSALDDLENERRRIYVDLDYLKKNKITLLRTEAFSPETYANDMTRLEKELAEVHGKMEAYQEAEHEILNYVVTFSELVKMAGLYYKHALDSEKRDLVTSAFTELIFSNGESTIIPKDGFSALFERHERTKNTQPGLSVISGSTGGCRTRLLRGFRGFKRGF